LQHSAFLVCNFLHFYFTTNNREIISEDLSENEVNAYFDELGRGSGLKINEIELNGFLTNYADKIIVHSQEAKEKLLKKNIGRYVRWIRSY